MNLFPTHDNIAPEQISCLELRTGDGIRLRAAYSIPPKARGTVLILSGRAEFIEHYFETMRDLYQRNLGVAVFDWRGQGGSQRLLSNPLAGYVDSFASYDSDLEAIVSRLLEARCPKPFYGLAHSAGGNVMLRALRGRKWLERAVIMAPLLGFQYGLWPEFLVRTITLGATAMGLGKAYLPGRAQLPGNSTFSTNSLTSDKVRFERDVITLRLHPELGIGGPTFSWLRAATASIDELMRWPKDHPPSCPTLIAMASMDKVVNNEATKKFLNRAPGFSALSIPGARHEIINERDEIRRGFLSAFDSFIAG